MTATASSLIGGRILPWALRPVLECDLLVTVRPANNLQRYYVEISVAAARQAIKSGGFARSTKAAQPYLIELADVSLLFTATQAVYDETVEEGLWSSGAS